MPLASLAPSDITRHIKVTVETFSVDDNGNEMLEDRSVTESWNLTVAQVVDMRKPLLSVAQAWNEGDLV